MMRRAAMCPRAPTRNAWYRFAKRVAYIRMYHVERPRGNSQYTHTEHCARTHVRVRAVHMYICERTWAYEPVVSFQLISAAAITPGLLSCSFLSLFRRSLLGQLRFLPFAKTAASGGDKKQAPLYECVGWLV